MAAYRTYIEQNAATLVSRTNAFVKAVQDGDIERAKSLFAWAREPYEAIEPVAESFGDLDPAIDARRERRARPTTGPASTGSRRRCGSTGRSTG